MTFPAGARIEDVARSAGVSTATVSRALRNLPNVSPQARQAVLHAATSLGYVASRAASNLASGRTLAVAVVAPFMERWFFSQVIAAVESTLRAEGYDALLIGLHQPEGGGPREPFEPEVLRGRVDAVVVVTLPLTGVELDGLRALRLPTVCVGAAVGGAMSVRIDDMAAARLVTEHLIGLGHRKIAFVGGDPAQQINFSAPSDRRAGWMASLRSAGLEPRADYDVPGGFTPSGGQQACRLLMAQADPPTAVFAASDEMAFGVVAAAEELGLAVPADLSVAGVDGHELGPLFGLTTVVQPVAEQGRLAAQLLLRSLGGRQALGLEHVVVPVHLRTGRTTGAPGPERSRPRSGSSAAALGPTRAHL